MKKPLPPMPQWAKHLKPNSRVATSEIAELFGIKHNSVSPFMKSRMISFASYIGHSNRLKNYYLWSEVLEVYNNEIKEAEK